MTTPFFALRKSHAWSYAARAICLLGVLLLAPSVAGAQGSTEVQKGGGNRSVNLSVEHGSEVVSTDFFGDRDSAVVRLLVTPWDSAAAKEIHLSVSDARGDRVLPVKLASPDGGTPNKGSAVADEGPTLVAGAAGSGIAEVRIPAVLLARGMVELTLSTDTTTSNRVSVAVPAAWAGWSSVLAALSTFGVCLILFYVVRPLMKRITAGRWPNKVLQVLLVEGDSGGYSLSRLQFCLWSLLGIFAFCYLFWVGVLVRATAELPNISNLYALILTSAATWVGASAVGMVRGPKGAGVAEASISDLVTSGGLVSIDRLQYLAWTIVVGVTYFFVLVFKPKLTLLAAPEIPNEILALFGASTAGYLGGKASRPKGPVVDQVMVVPGQAASDPITMTILGKNLSTKPTLHVNGAELATTSSGGPVASGQVSIAVPVQTPSEAQFVDRLSIFLSPSSAGTLKSLRVTNPDGQFSEWVPG